MIDIGGGSEKQGKVEGIHWHVSEDNKVEYISSSESREDIAWVGYTDGNTVEYESVDDPLEEEGKAAAELRTMDCIDCHNRPSHHYRSPNRTINLTGFDAIECREKLENRR